ncbi:MAG: hypothetical protein QOK15_1193 [Nocardioidaceae bacterium]|jgi:hypothetical protein|nr:hypothetical protein [Nocardioidaceae bacterium]
MSFSRTPLVAAVAAVFLAAAPASAQNLAASDPAGDASGPGLDITRVVYRNLDHRVVARVRFAAAVPGDLIVSVDPRGGTGLRLVSQYRPHRTTTSFVLHGAFSDGRTQPVVSCPRFQVTWDRAADRAILRMPSTCLHHGNFGAVRFGVLTEEARGGGDTDYAPGDPSQTTAWVPRG